MSGVQLPYGPRFSTCMLRKGGYSRPTVPLLLRSVRTLCLVDRRTILHKSSTSTTSSYGLSTDVFVPTISPFPYPHAFLSFLTPYQE